MIAPRASNVQIENSFGRRLAQGSIADINKLDFKSILSKAQTKEGELDILIGGPPCQGFSTAGTRFWEDPRNELLKRVKQLGRKVW